MTTSLPPIRTSYYLRVRNAGDLLNTNIVSAASGRSIYFSRDKTKPFLLSSGSVLSGATKTTVVWGSGLMHPDRGLIAGRPENIYLLRGKQTHAALCASGLNPGDIPLGDPLFLAADALGIERCGTICNRIGVMPHYADRSSPLIRALIKQDNAVDLNVHSDPIALMHQIAACDQVITTCLHGLILAESLGIPSLWVKTDKVFAGDGFEFLDWFSICRTPQAAPWSLTGTEKLTELASACQRHEPDITLSDLRDAFPKNRLAELEETGLSQDYIPVQECRNRATPVFVISFNRGRMTRNLFNSLKKLDKPVDVIIHDNGSDDANAVRELDRLSQDGATVIRRAKISSADELDNVNETVTDYFRNWAEPQNYIVTDCDISVSTCDTDYLNVLSGILDQFHDVACAGPMLQLHDISKTNPLYGHILKTHIRQFWLKLPIFTKVREQMVAFQYAPIDTTLAMHRGGEPFKRLKSGIRTYAPYEARHLDWYEEEQEESYKHSSNSKISHWGNSEFAAKLSVAKLPYEFYYRVDSDERGNLTVEKIDVNGKEARIKEIEAELKSVANAFSQKKTELRKTKEEHRYHLKMLQDKNHLLNNVKYQRDAALMASDKPPAQTSHCFQA
tara:strand:- start:115 stop:1971 length:1857 start_codon:yes stop_codon:yes gene_type:complete